ncbi:hypothetical protein MKX01_035817, partial [Papaver californicum]
MLRSLAGALITLAESKDGYYKPLSFQFIFVDKSYSNTSSSLLSSSSSSSILCSYSIISLYRFSIFTEIQSSRTAVDAMANNPKLSKSQSEKLPEVPRSLSGARATDSARVMKFSKELSGSTVILGCLIDIPDTERSEDEISMLRQIAVDCPRTIPDVTFFQQIEVQKSLERILYTWLEFFLIQWLQCPTYPYRLRNISNMEADCYWCLSKLLDGMQDHYTFAQPGIQRLVFKLKELVRRIYEPVSRHMEEQGLEFLQFSFRWFNCLLITEF